MRFLFLIFLLLLLPAIITAQNVVTGKVNDKSTNQTLDGATILMDGNKAVAKTNNLGNFIFNNVPSGNHQITAKFIGYSDTTITFYFDGKSPLVLLISLTPSFTQIPSVFITASRTEKTTDDIAASVSIINRNDINDFPANNTIDLLNLVPGMSISNEFGIFSKNASVTMRGLNGSPRVLILLNGIPLNKTDGGGINWNRIDPDNIDRIEIVKGPVSALYGGNAMGGVINIITLEPQKPLEVYAKAFAGSYNTFGGNVLLSGMKIKNDKGFYWSATGFYRQGDGYIVAPDSTRDSLDVKTYLKEISTGAKLGYQFKRNCFAEIEYDYYDDMRGDGTKIYEEDGGYNRYTTNAVRSSIHYDIGKSKLLMNIFYQYENYQRQVETRAVKKANKYTLYDTDSYRKDKGIWMSISRDFSHNQSLIAGIDLKQGSVDASDIYYTSSDILTNKGNMNFAALFADYTISLLKRRLILNAAMRYDIVQFNHGSFAISDPSTLTDFMTAYPTDFTDTIWHAISPKLAAKYIFNKNISLYANVSKGFRPPMLDDMCKNGNVGKGFKLANPHLRPEVLINYEIGATLHLQNKLVIEPSIYYSVGNDFQYFVGTGDSIYTGGDNLKPVLKRENISKASIYGAEISLTYRFNNHWMFISNYAYNYSKVTDFELKTNPAIDLTGKYLVEVSPHQVFAGVYWKNKIVNTSLIGNFSDKQWVDDLNTQQTPSSMTFDVKFAKEIKSRFNISLTIHDIFNQRPVDSKGELSTGRFFMLSASYKLY